jgi:hypothetical protein
MTGIIYTYTVGGATVSVSEGENGPVWVNGRPVWLAAAERLFLLILAQAKGKNVTARMHLDELYGARRAPDLKILDVYACKIRNKLHAKCSDAASAVRTVWGRGYAFGTPEAEPVPVPHGLGLPLATDRWTTTRKALVVESINEGLVTMGQVLSFYPDLSCKELGEWNQQFSRFGHEGLRTTRTQYYQNRFAA